MQNMTKIEIFMPQNAGGIEAVLGGHGVGNSWVSSGARPWADGKVTINSSDFPHRPADVYKFEGSTTGGYLILVDGWWGKTWSELGVTKIVIHHSK
jgi:hypothetical protein